MTPLAPRDPPRSATGTAITTTAFALAAAAAFVLARHVASPVLLGLIGLCLAAAGSILGDLIVLKVHRRPEAGLGAARSFDVGQARTRRPRTFRGIPFRLTRPPQPPSF